MRNTRHLLGLVSLLFVFFLAACTESISSEEYIELATEQLELPSQTSQSLILPGSITILEEEILISWSTSDAQYITTSGVVNRPTFSDGNQSVILTATLIHGEFSATKTYTILVLALPAQTYVVTFESNGGTSVSSQNVTEGQLATEPTVPTRTGYTFHGWYQDATLLIPFSFSETMPTENLTLYAKWQAIPTYTVTFLPDNGTVIPSQTVYQNGLAVEPVQPVKPGYTFLHWIKEDLTVWNFSTVQVTSNVTLYANYAILTYTVTYVIPEGATLIPGGVTSYTVIDPINDLGSATKEYADFLGWFDAPTGGNKVTGYPVGTVGNITLYARFEDHIPKVVRFDDGLGNVTSQERWEGQYALPIADPLRPGYTFVGWFVQLSDTEPFNFSTQILSDITLYAKYEIITYAINYDLKGGTATNPSIYTVETESIVFNPATKLGHSFIGWTLVDGSGEIVTSLPKGSFGHKMYYATFVETEYTITYHLNGGVLSTPNPLVYRISSSFILNNPTKEGYQFEGWYNHPTDGVMIESFEPGQTGHVTLYARWVELVMVSFYDEGNLLIAQYVKSDAWPATEFVLTEDGLLYGKGSNQKGQLGNGSLMDAPRWIHLTSYLPLNASEWIEMFSYVEDRIVVLTSSGRVIVWGYRYTDLEGKPVYSHTPTDVTSVFGLTSTSVDEIYNYGSFFVIRTSDGKIVLFEDGGMQQSNPLYNGLGTETTSPLYTGTKPSRFYRQGNRYFVIHDTETGVAWLEITSTLDIQPLQTIHGMFTESSGLHILNGNQYVYGFLTHQLETPFAVIKVPMTLTLNQGESVVGLLGGNGVLTSQGRVLVTIFVMANESDEIPSEIRYVDITSELELQPGESVRLVVDPGLILTNFNRLLLPMIDELFTLDPNFVPVVALMQIDIEPLLKPGESIESIEWGNELFVITNLGRKILQEKNQESFVLIDFVVTGVTLVHQGLYPMTSSSLFVPIDRPFEDFAGWYIDENLTTPFESIHMADGLVLYAQWTFTHYFIDFGNEWDDLGIERMAIPFGAVPTQPEAPIKPYFVLSGWYMYDQELGYVAYDFSYPLDRDTRLYPMFDPIESDVTIVYQPINQSVTRRGYDYYQAKDLYIEMPLGYELVGIFLDEMMTIPAGDNDLIANHKTLYVLIQPTTYQIYYVESYETISFTDLFFVEQTQFGTTSDGRFFAWGSNWNGALGIGNPTYFNLDTPIDITAFLGLQDGETVIDIQGYFGTMVVMTSQQRFIAWGFKDASYELVLQPTDLTPLLALESMNVAAYFLGYDALYVISSDGQILQLSLMDALVKSYATGITISNLLYVNKTGFGGHDLLLIQPHSIHMIALQSDLSVSVLDFSAQLASETVLAIESSFVGYLAKEAFLSDGRVLLVDTIMEQVTLDRTFPLLEHETVIRVISNQGGFPMVLTNQNRIIHKGWDGVVKGYQTNVLLPGETILISVFGSVLTNFGQRYWLNDETESLMNPEQVYAVGSDTILYYVRSIWAYVGYTTGHEFVIEGETKTLYEKRAASSVVIETYAFGTEWIPRVVEGPNATDFLFWSVHPEITNPFEESIVSDLFLYAVYMQE